MAATLKMRDDTQKFILELAAEAQLQAAPRRRPAGSRPRRATMADMLGLSPLALLAACGGGGGAGTIPAPPSGTPSPSPSPTPTPTPSITAQADAFTVAGDSPTPAAGNVLANDVAAGGTATVTSFGLQGGAAVAAGQAVAGTLGTLIINTDGGFSFAPATASGAVRGLASGQTATETFTYTPTVGATAGTAQTVTATVQGANDAPVVSAAIATATVNEGATLTIPVPAAAFSDPDQGSVLTLTARLADGSALPGFITFDPAARSFSVAPGFSAAGTYAVRLTATDQIGASVSQVFNVQVNNVVSGFVADGYIRGATVFVDANGDGLLSAGEPSTTTNASGRYTIDTGFRGPIIATGGTNIDTGLANNVRLSAPDGYSAVNALTTVAQRLVASGHSAAAAEQLVERAFNIPAQFDLATLDFIENTIAPYTGFRVGAVKVVNILETARATGGGVAEQQVLQRLADAVASAPGQLLFDTPQELKPIYAAAFGDAVATELAVRVAAMNLEIRRTDGAGPQIAAKQLELASNQPPIANNKTITIDEDVQVERFITSGDGDTDSAAYYVAAINDVLIPAGGTTIVANNFTYASRGPGSYSVTITPPANFFGQTSFTYMITDAEGGIARATVTVIVRPRPENDAATVAAGGTSVSGNILTNDNDVPGTQYTISRAGGVDFPTPEARLTGGTYGRMTLDGNGAYTYTLDYTDPDTQRLRPGETAIDRIVYSIRDVNGVDGGSAALSVTVTGINDAPTLASVTTTNPLSTFSTAPLSGTIAMSDVDGDTPTFVGFRNNAGTLGTFGVPLQGDFGTLRITSDRFYTYTPDANATAYKALPAGVVGTEQFFYTASDGQLTTEATFRRQWTGVNDAPVANNDTGFSVTEDAPQTTVSGNVRTNDTDPDAGATLTVASVAGSGANVAQTVVGTYGSVVINADGSFVYTLDNADPDTNALVTGQTVTETFIYGISDGSLSAQAELQISVIGMNG